MCETKAVVVSILFILLVAASFWKIQAHAENKVGHHKEIISQGPSKKVEDMMIERWRMLLSS